MKQQFEAPMFVTLQYKGCNWKREADKALNGYLKAMTEKGINVTSCELVKENQKSGNHDGYAIGNYYKISGDIDKCKDNENTKFQIFHNSRSHDYFCVSPILYRQIKLIN